MSQNYKITLHKNPAKTLFIGKRLEYVPECHSSNDLLAQLGREKSLPEGFVLVTGYQTAGKGQQGNSWESEPGQNLMCSVYLKPVFLHAEQQYHLNKAIALGIYDALSELSDKQFFIKWPNDILSDRKKVCGILVENSIRNTVIQDSIVGIGINVNQDQFVSPAATSLKMLNKRSFELSDVLESVLEHLEYRYLQLRAKQWSALERDYLQHLYGLNQKLQFKAEGKIFDGIIKGVDMHGRLMLEQEGVMKYYGLKEISLL